MYDDWRNATIETAPNLILTGVMTDTEDGFKPSTAFIDWMDVHAKVLDFGTGIGRNTFALAEKFQTVHGYDFPNMIAMAKARKPAECWNVTLYADWNDVKCQKYDAIFASLVLQHIQPPDLRTYSNDFANMTNVIYMMTRNYTDGYRKSVYDVLSDNWEIADIFKGYKDPPLDTLAKIKNASGEEQYAVKLIRRIHEVEGSLDK